MTSPAPETPRPRLPGDPDRAELLARMLRVDHAGEQGAVRIYEGQLAVLGQTKTGAVIRQMAAQEKRHLDTFNKMLPARQVRPTLLSPIWHVAGFALGAATALMGERAAMACTVAVEEVIDEHYAKQTRALDQEFGAQEAPLRDTIEEFRREEVQHRDEGLAHGATETPGYEVLSAAIKAGSRLAIWLSTRL
jgi:3-demethoxyubiquinol 3-hydroxylase